MEMESVRSYCMGLPRVTEDMAFGDDLVLFRVENHIFVCMSLMSPVTLAVKSDPMRAVELRERHDEIEPAWHWNKKYWIQFRPDFSLGADMVRALIRASYHEVVKKLPKRVRDAYPELMTIF